jgi:methionine-S-sulfoxide reductase
MQKAIFAAGCFWGVQYYFDQVPGVKNSVVGYTGGHTTDPTWESTETGTTGHTEAIELEFDEKEVSYETLLKHFFRIHDPTTPNRQGPNIGSNYRSAIFYLSNSQKETAERVLKDTQTKFKDPIITEIAKAGHFYRAEEFHQKFTEQRGYGTCGVDYKPI